MYFDQQPVRARGHRGPGHRDHFVSDPRTVARIRDHRKVRELFDHRDGADVERVPGIVLERPDPPFTEDHLMIASGHDVLCGHQPVLDGRGHPALQHHRLVRFSQIPQEREVLHVPRPHLKDVRVLGHHRDEGPVHHLRDHQQTEAIPGVPEDLESLLPQPLEAVGRGARFERTAPQHDRAGPLHDLRNRHRLFAILHRAGAGHNGELLPADPQLSDSDDRILRAESTARELVGLSDPQHLVYAGQNLQIPRIHPGLVSDSADHRPAHPCRAMDIEPQLAQTRDDALNLFLRCGGLHHNHHLDPSLLRARRA